jgi:hypothetical protein
VGVAGNRAIGTDPNKGYLPAPSSVFNPITFDPTTSDPTDIIPNNNYLANPNGIRPTVVNADGGSKPGFGTSRAIGADPNTRYLPNPEGISPTVLKPRSVDPTVVNPDEA